LSLKQLQNFKQCSKRKNSVAGRGIEQKEKVAEGLFDYRSSEAQAQIR
jgi:hypothetical protein